MSLLDEYRQARRAEDVARLRRVLALRAMIAAGMTQRQIAEELGITQPAVSQQLKFASQLDQAHPETLIEAAAPILKALASDHRYTRLAVFGSVARHQARPDSDIDLIVEAPAGTSSFAFIRFKQLIERVLGREVDLIDYGGLNPVSTPTSAERPCCCDGPDDHDSATHTWVCAGSMGLTERRCQWPVGAPSVLG